jgi:hypothetical protein
MLQNAFNLQHIGFKFKGQLKTLFKMRKTETTHTRASKVKEIQKFERGSSENAGRQFASICCKIDKIICPIASYWLCAGQQSKFCSPTHGHMAIVGKRKFWPLFYWKYTMYTGAVILLYNRTVLYTL